VSLQHKTSICHCNTRHTCVTATHLQIMQDIYMSLQCSTLQHTHCNTHCNARCNTLRHICAEDIHLQIAENIDVSNKISCCIAILQHTETHLLHCDTATHCDTPLRYCNTLRHTCNSWNAEGIISAILTHRNTHCNTLRHTATHCNTPATHLQLAERRVHRIGDLDALLHTPQHTLQHPATHCNTPATRGTPSAFHRQS